MDKQDRREREREHDEKILTFHLVWTYLQCLKQIFMSKYVKREKTYNNKAKHKNKNKKFVLYCFSYITTVGVRSLSRKERVEGRDFECRRSVVGNVDNR